ncbi:protein-methionine sulfoxide oxidase mical3a-like isoform X20 [Salvelinus fontinalis]|uniref:protein-methionine sulfoxide oxidase mical3a-like isoform X20 n=1 Tax=Salvelinus fontinalis TaxID=8038 RepID=UPI002486BCBA|nr:protein-methionine sulfoxide oxidase mical3a-like isoform X20 [Salvelinus fontinalis]
MGTMGDLGGFTTTGERVNPAHILFDRFVQASTCKGTLKAFQELCDHLELKPCEYRVFYHKLKSRLNYWKAKALWAKLDKRAGQKEYKKGRACTNSKCLIIGAGPCGLRTAIELGFLGAKVVLLEKRDAFSRNNVLHLWPFTIQDLRGLGAKKFYGKFCAGAIDHISIRQLQLMLLKVALLLGIEIHVNAEFKGLIEPPEDQENERIGWRAEVLPRTHPVNELEFDVIIGADGRRNTLAGFRRKEFRGKLAIAITANFINRNTTAEAKVEEISGVAFIFNQKFFQDLREATGIDLENIVYYKDDTHYFVMTAKKQSLLEKGVILHDYADTEMLLSRANVDQAALLSYACEAADFSTNHQLPTLDFAINHYGQPDVAMFDFTCMYASENAALVRQRNGRQLLVSLVGDSLLEPFWPMGTGIARGFLAAMDSGWMVKSWAQGNTSLDVLAERESIYRLLPQTTPENINKNFSHYSVDPTTRYPNISLHFLRPNQVRHLIDTGDSSREMLIEMENVVNSSTPKLTRNESIARSSKLLNWCQRQTEGYRKVSVTDLTMSWKSGMALCALIHRYRPDLIDFDSLDERDQQKNNQLGFDVAEREFGISPCMTGKEMSQVSEPDKLSMVMYLSQFYEMFKDTVPPGAGGDQNMSPEEKAALINSTKSPISFLSKLGQSIAISRKRNPKDKKEKEVDGLGKRRKTSQADHSEDEEVLRGNRDDRPSNSTALTERKMKEESAAVGNHNKVKSMATQLLAKFEENAPAESKGLKRQGDSLPSLGVVLALPPPPASLGPPREPVRLAPVPAWRQKRTQQQEQLSFRYKEKVKCQTLPIRGEQRYLKMYTGEVSLLAEQIANQLQPQEEPKPLLDKRELGSLRKEFPQNIGGSDVCFFCRKRVYVMERLSAEGKFFHRSCFKCDYCGTTLRLSSYAFDVEDGKFYCKPHYCYRSSGQAQRKRPAPIPALLNAKDNQGSLPAAVTVDSPGRGAMASPSPTERRSSVPEVNGLQEPSLAKRLRGTPERIELENYRLSLQREEDLEEVPEETLAEHNLSSVLDKDAHADLGSSSSESDMEEEDQEEEEQHEEEQQEPPSPSDLGGVPWKEAVELHAKLKTDSDPGAEGEDGEGEDETHGHIARDLEVEEEDDEEEEEDDDAESTDEGEYCPWEQELQSGIWLENLQDEEDTCRFKARNLQIQQVLQPVDPTGIKNLRRVSVLSEGDKEEPPASASQPSTTLTQSPFTEPCEDDDPEAEVGSRDFEPGTEMDQEDIPSDAEAEARLHQSELSDALPEEDKKSQSQGIAYSIEQTSVSPVKLDGEVGLLPVKPPTPQPDLQMSHTSPPYLVKSPGMHFFPDPFASENVTIPQRTVHTPNAKSPQYATPAPSPIHSPVQSPIRSQPIPLPETVTPKSPVTSPPCSCPPTGNPLSPICAQPLPCHEPSSPLSSDSPVRTQPVPAITSTPLAKPASSDRTTPEPQKSLDLTDETPVKKTDIIEEFWLKSAEIRKSLGLTPLDRSSSSKAPEKCHVTVGKVLTPDSPSTKSYTPEDLSEELRPSPSPFTGRSVIRRLNITVEGQVISPAEPKSNGSERRDLSSSSGLGLNDSTATNQNSQAASDSYHTSDSTMLTPPSSPPPPPPNEEPATLRQQQKHQVSWDNGIDGPTTPEPAKAAPTKTNSPVPAPRTQLSPVSMPVSAPKPAPRTTPVTSPVTSPVTAPVTPLVVMRREKSSKPRREEVRKSFVECVAEIPFADDVEDTFDERTPDTTMDRFYTPPSSKPNREREKRPLHLALAMENGKPIFPVNQQVSKSQKAQQFSPEAKEIAEERMRAREKSIKSQALKEAMAKQLNKMRETDTAKGAAAAAKVVWNVASSETSGKSTKKSSGSPKTSAVKSLESKKGETLPERFFSSQGNKSLDSSTVSSDGSASGGKSKKRSSLFSPRKNKKEKKAKNESQLSAKHGTDETPSPPKHKSLWKAVFSGYKKDKKKNKDDKSCPSTPSSSNTNDSGKKRLSPLGRSSDLKSRRNLSFSEDSDLSCDDVLERSSQKSRTDSVYVPHALAFKRAYATKKTYTEEELNAKLTRRVQKAARRQAKQEELKRLHRAQTIQRQLEQVEEKQRQLEERGVAVEKALRGEAGLYKGTYCTIPKQHKRRSDYWGESNYSEILDLHLGVEPFVGTPRRRPISFCPCCSPEAKAGSSTQEHSHSIFVCTVFFLFVLQETQPLQLRMGKKDDPKLMQEWFKLVQEKNALVRYESELMIFARELELEDRQSRLQQDLRERMAIEDHLKTEVELAQEKHILNEMLEVVEQRDSLVALLEEQRLREKEEDKDLESVMLSKGFNLNWS